MHTSTGEIAYSCPRCKAEVVERFYGPCEGCRGDLRAATATAPAAPTTTSTTLTKRRHWHQSARPVVFVEWETGTAVDGDGRRFTVPPHCTAAELVEHAAGYRLVYLCGDDVATVVRAGIYAQPDGWAQHGARQHNSEPAVTFRRDVDGATVRVGVAATWVADGASPAACAAAWQWVGSQVADRFRGGVLAATPAGTGRDLLARAFPTGVELPVLTDEVQAEIRDTATQHRMSLELPDVDVPGLVELDMRLAYAAVVRALPAGVPERRRGEPQPWDEYRLGRYLARWEVPDSWEAPGLLPTLVDGEGWRWPSEPGEVGTGWLDGSELRLARRRGWRVTVSESLLWPEAQACDPLRQWREKLVAIFDEVEADKDRPDEVRRVARAMIRAVIVRGLGTLQGRDEVVTMTCPADEADGRVPEGADWHLADDGRAVTWTERRPSQWSEFSRPEWCAAVWARTRCRLLDAPGVAKMKGRKAAPTGALNLPPGCQLVAFRGDAIYVTRDPQWHDDGAPGRFRVKGTHGPLHVPASFPELDRLRRPKPADPLAVAAAQAAARAALGR